MVWERQAVPEVGGRPQALINSQAVDRADVVVAFFDSRLGSHTGVDVSGTAEEIHRATDLGKPVHVYFSNERLPRDTDPGHSPRSMPSATSSSETHSWGHMPTPRILQPKWCAQSSPTLKPEIGPGLPKRWGGGEQTFGGVTTMRSSRRASIARAACNTGRSRTVL